ncbi:MAG: helix-turn-helix domain-containing protein [Firmicutes bacterium]|uniref:Helix-turn-helix domain-containing protein n=1 Tax=Candidatus Scatoplasma merdavium TaxID=2840932 RepID=A0A9D9D9J3_9BACL|nr:helix-turn-helix domain-containing protein [Candidatus Scatoplasma merdavium]
MQNLKTASDLFIHRNTLLYRLNKIEKILNFSFEDNNICLAYLNTLQI